LDLGDLKGVIMNNKSVVLVIVLILGFILALGCTESNDNVEAVQAEQAIPAEDGVAEEETDLKETTASAPSELGSTQTTANSPGYLPIVATNYKCGSWSDDQYPLIRLFGESYVPLYPSNEKIWSAHVDKLAKLVLDLPEEGEKYSLMKGEILDLGQGYGLEAKQIDVANQMVWFEFTKDEEFVADDIIKIGSGDDTLSVDLNNIQGISSVVVFKVHVSEIFQYESDSVVMIDGLWLIDYTNTKNLKLGDKFGEFTLKEITNGVDESNPGYLVFESDN
jgi:S-layer protein (TIGR01567 family)